LIDEHPPETFLRNDPLGMVRRHRPEERVIVAHIAAALAYGSVELIRRAIGEVVDALSTVTPLSEGTLRYEPGMLASQLPGWRYRMTPIEALDAYLVGLARLIEEYGSLEDAFLAGDSPADDDTRPALERYVHRLRDRMPHETRSTRYITPDPATGSACKRWHLLLRWLARPDDGVDLGLWTRVKTERLLLPLDRHVASLVRSLHLTERKSVDYKMSKQATAELRQLDAQDPMRYDMPLCHLGISGRCKHRYEADICGSCGLQSLCRWTEAEPVAAS
jgi:uncharacterized protein (TIGR02757 family)